VEGRAWNTCNIKTQTGIPLRVKQKEIKFFHEISHTLNIYVRIVSTKSTLKYENENEIKNKLNLKLNLNN